jgi:precorrin-2/cobalt-factor-2 C20-methyltransferase
VSGRLIGVGTGPGDPELLTLKALRVLREADVVAYFAKAGRHGHAHTTAAAYLRPGVTELPLLYPVTNEIEKCREDYKSAIRNFFDTSAAAVEGHLKQGSTVAVLSEGDPFFYGSYMHLHVRLSDRYPTDVVPGITSMSGCWSLAGTPAVQGDDSLCVLPGTLPESELVRRLGDCDAAVIMKVARNLPKIRCALTRSGRIERAIYAERGTMMGGLTIRLADKTDDIAPYFSLVIVPGWERRS